MIKYHDKYLLNRL